MVTRHLEDGMPKAHVAAEYRVARSTVTTWVDRYLDEGEEGLADRASTPSFSPTQTAPEVIERIEALRRSRKWSARRIWHHLSTGGYDHDADDENGPVHAPVSIAVRTVGRWLHRLGISRLRDLTPSGEQARRPPQQIRAAWAGHMIHLDVKKLGRIPDGGGWRAHGRGTEAARASKRRARIGYTYLHSAVDGYSRLAYTEALEDEKAVTTIGFFARARVFFAAHGIETIHRVVTDNGGNYLAKDFTRTIESLAGRHQRIRAYTPRHNGKVERYNQLLVDEVLYTRPYASETVSPRVC
jgi:transposase